VKMAISWKNNITLVPEGKQNLTVEYNTPVLNHESDLLKLIHFDCVHEFDAAKESIELLYHVNLVEQSQINHFGSSQDQFDAF